MSSPYLARPVRSLAQAIEEIARDRQISIEDLYRQSGSTLPSDKAKPAALIAAKRAESNS